MLTKRHREWLLTLALIAVILVVVVVDFGWMSGVKYGLPVAMVATAGRLLFKRLSEMKRTRFEEGLMNVLSGEQQRRKDQRTQDAKHTRFEESFKKFPSETAGEQEHAHNAVKAYRSSADDVEQAARKLSAIHREGHELYEKETYFRHPYHYNGDQAKEYERQYTEKFREFIPIGEELYKKGGEELMIQVCDRVRSIGGDLAARRVESYWNGIGEWQG
jgi:hypothetical protein